MSKMSVDFFLYQIQRRYTEFYFRGRGVVTGNIYHPKSLKQTHYSI